MAHPQHREEPAGPILSNYFTLSNCFTHETLKELGRYYPQHEEFVVSPPVVTSGMHEILCGHIHTLNE